MSIADNAAQLSQDEWQWVNAQLGAVGAGGVQLQPESGLAKRRFIVFSGAFGLFFAFFLVIYFTAGRDEVSPGVLIGVAVVLGLLELLMVYNYRKEKAPRLLVLTPAGIEYFETKKGQLAQQWSHRWCDLSGVGVKTITIPRGNGRTTTQEVGTALYLHDGNEVVFHDLVYGGNFRQGRVLVAEAHQRFFEASKAFPAQAPGAMGEQAFPTANPGYTTQQVMPAPQQTYGGQMPSQPPQQPGQDVVPPQQPSSPFQAPSSPFQGQQPPSSPFQN